MPLFRRLAVFGALALFACDSEETVITEEEVTIAEYQYAPDDDQVDADGTLHRRGTASIFPDGKTDPTFPRDGIAFDAAIAPANTDKESTVTMTDTFHKVARIFFVNGDGSRFGMREKDGTGETLFARMPDGTYQADGVVVKDRFDAVAQARKNAFISATPHEVFLLTFTIARDGFVDAKKRGNPTCNPPSGPGDVQRNYSPTSVAEALTQ